MPSRSSPLAPLLRALADRLDAAVLPAIWERVSLPTATIRAELRALGVEAPEPGLGAGLEDDRVAEASRRVAAAAARDATLAGAAAGLGGLATVPPELALNAVLALRMAQRLAVVHGIDPSTRDGQLVLARAYAAALALPLPREARLDGRVSALPAIVSGHLPARSDLARALAARAVSRGATAVALRVGRAVPGLGPAVGAWSARRRVQRMAARMLEVLAAARAESTWDLSDEVTAEEV